MTIVLYAEYSTSTPSLMSKIYYVVCIQGAHRPPGTVVPVLLKYSYRTSKPLEITVERTSRTRSRDGISEYTGRGAAHFSPYVALRPVLVPNDDLCSVLHLRGTLVQVVYDGQNWNLHSYERRECLLLRGFKQDKLFHTSSSLFGLVTNKGHVHTIDSFLSSGTRNSTLWTEAWAIFGQQVPFRSSRL